MDESSIQLYGIRNTYKSEVRSSHATTVYKIDDLMGVQYGIRMLTKAVERLESSADAKRQVNDRRLVEDVAVWIEFILLRFEMHTGDTGDYGFQEYAEELTEAEREQFLKARQLRRSYIQHLSAKWLRETTLVINNVDDKSNDQKRILVELKKKALDGKMTKDEVEVEIPDDKGLQSPFYIAMEQNIRCLDWEVFSCGVEKVMAYLQRDQQNLQAKLVSEINSMSKSERAKIVYLLNKQG